MSEPPRVTMADVRACGFCVRGAREWFRRQGVDFAEFLSQGITVTFMEETGDELALRVAAVVRARSADGR